MLKDNVSGTGKTATPHLQRTTFSRIDPLTSQPSAGNPGFSSTLNDVHPAQPGINRGNTQTGPQQFVPAPGSYPGAAPTSSRGFVPPPPPGMTNQSQRFDDGMPRGGANNGAFFNPPPPPSNGKIAPLQQFRFLDIDDLNITKRQFDQWVSKFRFKMQVEYPQATVYEQALALVVNVTASEDSFRERQLRSYVMEHNPTLDELLTWIRANFTQKTTKWEADREIMNIMWDPSSGETIAEFRQRFLQTYLDALELPSIPEYEYSRLTERFMTSLPGDYKIHLVEKGIPMEFERLCDAVQAYVKQQEMLAEFNRVSNAKERGRPPPPLSESTDACT
jgi:hypothetical protein